MESAFVVFLLGNRHGRALFMPSHRAAESTLGTGYYGPILKIGRCASEG